METQHALNRIRPPRVQITYDVEVGDAFQQVELPFVVGVLADLAGNASTTMPALKDRKFIDVDRDNLDEVIASLNASLPLRVSNVLGGNNAPDLNVALQFNGVSDLSPDSIVQQVPQMKTLFDKRVALSDLLSRLDGNDALDDQLRALIDNPDMLSQLQKALASDKS